MQEKRTAVPCLTEEVEQIQLFEWARWASGKYPELEGYAPHTQRRRTFQIGSGTS